MSKTKRKWNKKVKLQFPSNYLNVVPFHTVLLSSHIYCSSANHCTQDFICAGRDLGYPKAIVSDQTKWKILCGFSCLLPWLQGCWALGSSDLQPPHPPLYFFNQMACSGVEGIKTAAAAAADDSVQFWKAHKHMHRGATQKHTAASLYTLI